ncbi:MAG: hypothetical protein R3F29_06165 [Planctomycetota bacterium]
MSFLALHLLFSVAATSAVDVDASLCAVRTDLAAGCLAPQAPSSVGGVRSVGTGASTVPGSTNGNGNGNGAPAEGKVAVAPQRPKGPAADAPTAGRQFFAGDPGTRPGARPASNSGGASANAPTARAPVARAPVAPRELASLATFGPQVTLGISYLSGDYEYEIDNPAAVDAIGADASRLALELDAITPGGGGIGFDLYYMPEVSEAIYGISGTTASTFGFRFTGGPQLQGERFQCPIRIGMLLEYTDVQYDAAGTSTSNDLTFGLLLRAAPEVALMTSESYRWTAGCSFEVGAGLTSISTESSDYTGSSTWVELHPFTRMQWRRFYVELGYTQRTFSTAEADDDYTTGIFYATDRTLSGVTIGAGIRF